MRVMINLLSSSSGGALSYVRNLLPLLIEKFSGDERHQLILLLYTKHSEEIGSVPDNVELALVPVERGGAKRVLWEMFVVPKLVKQYKTDVLYTPYQLAPHVSSVKSVVMIRNMEAFLFDKYHYDLKNYLRNVVLRFSSTRTLRRSDRIIAVSGFAEEQCTEHLGIAGEKVTRIYHGRDERFSPDPQDHDQELLNNLAVVGEYLFTCGSILPYRRVEHIISAFSRWPSATHYKLVVAGSGNDQNYRQIIDKLIDASPVRNNIIMLGHVSPEAMRVLYRRCKLFITATEIEACPNMGIEALSSGCAILSSDNKPMPEIFESAAVYFPSDDFTVLDKMLGERVEHASGVNEIALKQAGKYSWQQCAEQTYKQLTEWN